MIVSSGGRLVGFLEVVYDREHAIYTPVFDNNLATDVDQMSEAHFVHDCNTNTWYSLNGTTVTAMGEAVMWRLADPIELRDYGETLREYVGSKSKISAVQGGGHSTTGGWVIWGPVLAVVIVGIATIIITVRHEYKMTAPLYQARNRTDMTEHAGQLSRDESNTQSTAVRRDISRVTIDLSLLGDGAENDVDATAGETLGDTIPESHVDLPRDPGTQADPVRVLSIDSSLGTQVAIVSVAPSAVDARALQVLSQDEQANTRRHVESLGQMLFRALPTPEAAERPLDAVVAAIGPAPFTGPRAGLMTAGVIGRTGGVPVHGVSSLDAVARRTLDEFGTQEGQTGSVVLVATGARRREVYTALFRASNSDDVIHLTEIIAYSPAQIAQRLVEQTPEPGGGSRGVDVMVGPGASLYLKLVDIASCQRALTPASGDTLAQMRIVLVRLEHGEELSTRPFYPRHVDVQMPAGHKRMY